jgi:penicillin-binding protein 2
MAQASYKTRMLEAFRFRMFFFTSMAALVFLILLIQLINLQIIQGSDYKQKARSNMENYIPISASRGEIYDRNFKPGEPHATIVTNRPSFNITTVPAKFKSKKTLHAVLKDLSRIKDVNYDDLVNEINDKNPWERIIIKEDVGFDTIVSLASHQDRFPNVDWEDAPVRVYSHDNMFAHLIGYIGSISRDQYAVMKKQGYRHYQKIGKSGIEAQYDSELRGRDGYVRRIVDVRNRTEGEKVGLEPSAGNNLVLTIDYEIQKAAFLATANQKGAVIVLKPSTGEIIALLSRPDFDPNLVISKNNAKIIKDLNEDKEKPFLNRVIQSKYPPASTFKLMTALSGLESERILPSQSYFCGGKFTLKGYTDKDFYCYESHGTLDLEWAIAKSCSAYFYQLGLKIGPANILKYAAYFGLNEKTGIDLPGEIPGFVPSRQWKQKTFGQPWYDGDTVNLSIGQGFTSVTPIEMANFVCGIVNNGVVYTPQLVKEILTPDNRTVIKSFKKEKLREIPISVSSLATIKRGMRLSVTNGTSGGLGYVKVQLAGKTGTAQTTSRRKDDATQHAWFVGYGPYDGTPENSIVVVVFTEYGVTGAAASVPVAERIFSRLNDLGYFK